MPMTSQSELRQRIPRRALIALAVTPLALTGCMSLRGTRVLASPVGIVGFHSFAVAKPVDVDSHRSRSTYEEMDHER